VLKPVHGRLTQYANRTRGMTGRRRQRRSLSSPSDDRHTADRGRIAAGCVPVYALGATTYYVAKTGNDGNPGTHAAVVDGRALG